MRARLAEPRHTRCVCPNCGRKIKVGELILEQRIDDVSLHAVSANARLFVIHGSCVQAVLDDAPAPQDDRSVTFDLLRDRMLSTGRAFVDG